MATENKSNELCSEIVESKIKFRVNNISKLQKEFYGPSVSIRGMTFSPMIKPFEDVESRTSSLGFFLAFDLPSYAVAEGKGNKHQVNMVLKLIAQDGTTGDLVRMTSHELSTEATDWGYRKFIDWHEMVKPAWRKNDSILLEISFEIEEASNIEVQSETQTTTVTAQNTEKESKDLEKGVPFAKSNDRGNWNRTKPKPQLHGASLEEIRESQEKQTEKVKPAQPLMEEPITEVKDKNLSLEKIEIKDKSDSEKEGDGCLIETEKGADFENDIKTETLESGDSDTIGTYEKIEISGMKSTDDKEHDMPESTDDFRTAHFNLQDDDDSGSEYSLLNE